MNAKKFIASVTSLVITVLYIIVIKTVDVAKIGPDGTKVGLSKINGAFHNLTGVNMTLYNVTQVMGVIAIAVAGLFALTGLIQLIKRKSLFAVDREIIALGVLYAVVILLYILFEFVVINYRPIIMPGETAAEASFPSSHTMLVMVVMGSAIMLVNKFIYSDIIRLVLKILCGVIIALTVIGRLVCGVHWLTDIIGGVLISVTLLCIYSTVTE